MEDSEYESLYAEAQNEIDALQQRVESLEGESKELEVELRAAEDRIKKLEEVIDNECSAIKEAVEALLYQL